MPASIGVQTPRMVGKIVDADRTGNDQAGEFLPVGSASAGATGKFATGGRPPYWAEASLERRVCLEIPRISAAFVLLPFTMASTWRIWA